MGLFTRTYHVRPNQMGYLFRDNVLERELPPGRHEIGDWRGRTELLALPTVPRLLNVSNQEVLAKDNVALRFSYSLLYRIHDGRQLLSQLELNRPVPQLLAEVEQRLHNAAQSSIRQRIVQYASEELNEHRAELADLHSTELTAAVASLGIVIVEAQLRDLTFPKNIQDLFARHLEAKIRAKADLENARTAVATARALKNASELMKGDDNLRFFQFLETINKIADKGRHTFLVGEFPQQLKP